MIHLRLDCYGAWDAKDNRHAQIMMRDLGIEYMYAVPQSISDSWEFWCCENVPKKLPKYIESFEANPFDHIGYGLDKEMAQNISEYKEE